MRDGLHDRKPVSLLEPLSRNGDVDSVGMAVVDGDAATFLVHTGDTVDAGFLAVLEEGDTLGGAYTPVVADQTIGDTVADTDDTVFRIGYTGTKAFARIALTIPGATKCGVIGELTLLHETPQVDV